MGRFLDLALSAWSGPRNPSETDVLDWFMGCFPIRDAEVRAELRRTLDAALQERRQLGSG